VLSKWGFLIKTNGREESEKEKERTRERKKGNREEGNRRRQTTSTVLEDVE
jgi:hypothetical protein